MIKILAIGNSFSDDATRYLYPIAQAANVPMRLFNLSIGGCPLSKHYRMMKSGDEAYAFHFNSMNTGTSISLQRALANDDWDIVTLQQVSHCAPRYETYQPYLNELADFIRSYVPKSQLYLQQTWAYEQDSARLTQELGYRDQLDMYKDVRTSYERAALDIHARIIPSGEMMQRLIQNGFAPVHRDTFHAHLGFGRYAIAALWFDLLTGCSVEGNTFRALDVPSDNVDFTRIQQLAHALADEYR